MRWALRLTAVSRPSNLTHIEGMGVNPIPSFQSDESIEKEVKAS